jgi:hypothetical protein
MSVSAQPRRPLLSSADRSDALAAGLALLALYHLALAIFMAVAPHTFFTSIGPFGTSNVHYIRDTATFNAAIGAGFLVATRNAGWRIPMLSIALIQFALHSVNHLIDIAGAHPAWTGYFDFFALAVSTLLIAWLLLTARAERASDPHHPERRPR